MGKPGNKQQSSISNIFKRVPNYNYEKQGSEAIVPGIGGMGEQSSEDVYMSDAEKSPLQQGLGNQAKDVRELGGGLGNQAKDVPSQEPFSVPSHRRYDLGDTWYNEHGPDNQSGKATHWGDGSVHTVNYPNWEELNLKPIEPNSAYTRRFFSLKDKVDRAKREAEAKANKNIPK